MQNSAIDKFIFEFKMLNSVKIDETHIRGSPGAYELIIPGIIKGDLALPKMLSSEVIAIDLSDNDLVEFPSGIEKYHNLKKLSGRNNLIRTFPSMLINLNKLEYINLSNNQIQLDENSAHFPLLTELNLEGNSINELPAWICEHEYLTRLNLDHNPLQKLHENIGNLTKLEILFIGYAQLEKLPLSIKNLENLTFLSLFNNKYLMDLSALEQLVNLEDLYLGSLYLEASPPRLPSGITHYMDPWDVNLLEMEFYRTQI